MITKEERIEDLITKLRARGNRATPQRIAILDVLIAGEDHPTVEQIYEQVREDFPTTSLSTVYKTINLLKEMGEILELGLGDDSSRYDGRITDPHPHLVCVKCQAVVDLELDALEGLSRHVAEQTGYEVLGHRLVFLGVCPECRTSSPKTTQSQETGG